MYRSNTGTTIEPTTSRPISNPSPAPIITTNTPSINPSTFVTTSSSTSYPSISGVDVEQAIDANYIVAIMFDTQEWLFYFMISIFIFILIVIVVCITILVFKYKRVMRESEFKRRASDMVQANEIIKEPGAA